VTDYKAFCEGCGAVLPHEAGDGEIACTGCGLSREVDVRQLAAVMAYAELLPVQEMRFCDWCNERKPVGHDCPAGAVGCTTRQPDETPCGCCLRCLAAMAEDVARYGSPSDLDTP
jgi:hypothetical protein